MKAVLMSDEEYSEEQTFPTNAFRILNGEVTEVANLDVVLSEIDHDFAKISIPKCSEEQGIPESWYDEYAIRTNALMQQAKEIYQKELDEQEDD